MAIVARRSRTPAAQPQETQQEAPQETAPAPTRVARRTRSAPLAEQAPEVIPTVTVEEKPPAKKTAVMKYDGPAASDEQPAKPKMSHSRVDYDRIIQSYKDKATTPKKAIRSHCIDCMGGLIAEIGRCTSYDCSLYPFRMGNNPFHKLAKGNRETPDEE